MNSWMSIHERADIHNLSDWHKSFSCSVKELHNQCGFMASLEMFSATAPKVGIIRFSGSFVQYTDEWHGILSFGIYSTVFAQSLHLSHNSGHSQPVQSIIISGLFAELETQLKSSTIPLEGFRSEWHSLKTCMCVHHVLTAVAQHKQAISSTFDSSVHSERSEERARKVKPDEKGVAFCYRFTL